MKFLRELNEGVNAVILQNLLLKHKIPRIKSKYTAELDGESRWDLNEDLYLHILNYGRTAAIYFERNALENSQGVGSNLTKGWLVPVSREKEDFIKRYPWLKNLAGNSDFKISEKVNLDDFEEWVLSWVHRPQ
jgi:hypothetical protein